MRILFWAEQFWPYIGGVEVLGTRLALELVARGHELRVVTSHGSLELPDSAEYDGLPIERFRFREPLDRRDILAIAGVRQRLTAVRRRFTPEVVHFNFSGPSAYFHLATMDVCPCAWLVTVHQHLPESAAAGDSIIGRMLRTADWTAAVSASVLANLQRVVPGLTGRSSVVYNGIEPAVARPVPSVQGPPRLLCIGRLVPEKGMDVALAAFATLSKRFPDLRLTIAGDGPARGALESFVATAGIASAVDFLGWVVPSHVAALMSEATVVLVPSRWEEPFGLVALEAALMERPVVAARVGGLPEVVVHGETGLTFPREDAHALAEAVAWILEHPESAQRLGRAARARACSEFSLERVADDYEALYGRITRARG